MIQEPEEGLLARARAALAASRAGAGGTPSDDLRARAAAALAAPRPSLSDYPAALGRGIVESVAGGIAGAGDISEAVLGGESWMSGAAEGLRDLAPEPHPAVAESLVGSTLETAGSVGGFLAQSAAIPGSGLARGAGTAALMGVGAFGQGKDRALAEGASLDDAELAGLANVPSGVIQALPIGRAAGKVFGRAANVVAKNIALGSAANAAEFAGTNAVARAWSEAVAQSIHGEGDAKAVLDALTDTTLPEWIVGAALGGVATWRANQSGIRLSEQAKADAVAAGEAAARARAAKEDPEAVQGEDAADGLVDDRGVNEGSIEGSESTPRSTRIEVPDEALTAAAARLKKGARFDKDPDLYESPLADRGAEFGARVVDFDPGADTPVDGYYDRETKTIFLNRRAGYGARQRDLLRHELSHFADETQPDLSKEWQAALDELAPGWTKRVAQERKERQKEARSEGKKLPGLTKEGAQAEARAEGAEGLGTIMDFIEANPALVEKVAAYKPNLLTRLRDLLVAFTNKLGLTDKPLTRKLVDDLGATLREKGGDLEKSLEPEAAAQLGLRLRDIYSKLKAEEPAEAPRANQRPPPPPAPEPTPREAKATKAFLKQKDLSPAEVADSLREIDTRIEDGLIAGERADTPRMKEYAALRKQAAKRLFEVDPTHPMLGRETPFELWDKLNAEQEAASKQRVEEIKKRGEATEAQIAQIDAEARRIAQKRAADQMKKAAQYERDFQKMLKEEAAKEKVEAEERAKAEAEAKKAEAKKLEQERAADKRQRAEELKALKRDIRDRLKLEKKPAGRKLPVAKKDDGAELPLEGVHDKPEAVPPIIAPKKYADDRLRDPLARKMLEAMKAEAKWLMRGGEKSTMPGGNARDPNKEYARDSWVAEAEWWQRKSQAGFDYNEADTRNIIDRALAGERLERVQAKYVAWMLDQADARHFQGAEDPVSTAQARQYWIEQYGLLNDPAMREFEGPAMDESPLRDDEELPPTGTDDDVPFALRKGQGSFDFGEPTPEQKKAEVADLAAQAKAGDMRALGEILERNRGWLMSVVKSKMGEKLRARTTPEDVVQETYAQAARDFEKFNYRSEVELRAWLRTVANNVVGDVAERYSAAKRAAPETPMDAGEEGSEVRAGLRSGSRAPDEQSVVAEAEANIRRAIQSLKSENQRRALTMRYWSGAEFKEIGEALGIKEDAARMLVNRGEKEIHTFLYKNHLFALGGKGRDGSGVREFLARYQGTEPHYAVTTKGPVTMAARAAVEEFFEKEERTRAGTQAEARAILGTKSGKADVDAFIRGEKLVSPNETPAYIVAAEMRVNALLRASASNPTLYQKARDLALDYYGIRSDQGYTLSSVQRPRAPKEMLLSEIAEPFPQHLEEIKSLNRKLRQTKDAEARAAIKARIAEIKAAEAKALERGMLALKKAGIDLDAVNDPVSASIAYRTFMQAALDKATKASNMLIEWRASSMVSSASTITSSLVGNVANVGWNTVLTRLAEIPFKGGATAGEMKALAAALPGAMNKAMRAFWNVVRYDTATYEWNLQQKGLLADAQKFENAKLQAIPGTAGRIVRGLGLTPMTAMDEFARALGSELEAVGIAYRRSRGNKAEMVRLLASDAVWTEAVHRTRRSIFQEDNNTLVELGFKARGILDEASGGAIPLGTLMFPFVRTGANGLLEALRKMPGPATVIALRNRAQGKWKTDPELRARDMAAQLLSIGIGSTVWALAHMQDEDGVPFITGSPQGSRGEKALAWRTAPPVSLRPGGDQWYSYSKLMPFAGVTMTSIDAARSGLDPTTMVQSIGRQAIDSTYLRTLGTIIDTIQSEAPGDLKAAQATREFVASFVPNLVRGAFQAFQPTLKQDPLRREGEGSIEFTDPISTLGYRLAGQGADRYDWLGRPIEKGSNWAVRYFSPLPPVRRTEMHPADAVLRAWWEANPEKAYLPVDAPYWYKVRGETRYMTGKQYAEFQKRAGELTRSRLDWGSFDPKNPTQAQVDRIKKTIEQARRQARREVLREIPDEESDT